MEAVLQILGAFGVATLVVIAAGVITVFIIISKLKGVFKAFANVSSSKAPARIHLKAASDTKWQHASDLAGNREAAMRLGFLDLGTFTIDEMPGVILDALVKPQESSFC